MTHLPPDEGLELQRLQRELAANRRRLSELEELIHEVPAIYERKFDQKLQPLVEDVRLLSERNQALRDQLRQALSPAAAPDPGGDGPGGEQPTAERPRAPAAPAAPAPSAPAPAPSAPAPAPSAPAVAPPAAPPAPPPPAPTTEQPPRRTRRPWPQPRPPQLPRTVRLALLAAAGLGLAGGLGMQLLRSQASRSGAPARPSAAEGGGALAARDAQGRLILRLRSRGETWLDVRDQRGTALYAGLFQGERAFPIGEGLRLNAGKPELVSVRVGAGAERNLGHPGAWWLWHGFGPDGRQQVVPAP